MLVLFFNCVVLLVWMNLIKFSSKPLKPPPRAVWNVRISQDSRLFRTLHQKLVDEDVLTFSVILIIYFRALKKTDTVSPKPNDSDQSSLSFPHRTSLDFQMMRDMKKKINPRYSVSDEDVFPTLFLPLVCVCKPGGVWTKCCCCDPTGADAVGSPVPQRHRAGWEVSRHCPTTFFLSLSFRPAHSRLKMAAGVCAGGAPACVRACAHVWQSSLIVVFLAWLRWR